jgi:hypothetical protein
MKTVPDSFWTAGRRVLVMAAAVLMAWPAVAETVILRLRAANPSTTTNQTVTVSSVLPKPAQPADVIDAGGFEISYDLHNGYYAIRQEVTLAPREVRTFRLELRDLWMISEEDLTALETHVARLRDLLKGSRQKVTVEELSELILRQIGAMRERQNAAKLPEGRVVDHLRAWETNREVLQRVRKDLGVLENLVFGAGKDPGALEGSARAQPDAVPMEFAAGTVTNELTLKIRMTNPTDRSQSLPIRQDLPMEIGPADILDAGGLEALFDANRQVTYVYSAGIELGPRQERVFEVRIRDRWRQNTDHLDRLTGRATNLLSIAQTFKEYGSILTLSQGLVAELDALRTGGVPTIVNAEYVAQARDRERRIQTVESKILRLEELFRPQEIQRKLPEASMLDMPRPSTKTTWLIIYIILGFLGVFSLLFFLRWYGKSRAETNRSEGGEPPAAGGTPPT